MSKPKILVQLDTDPHASTFDGVVAVDAGVDHLMTRSGVNASTIESLVHGTMFTRGGEDLASTAIFVGGSDVGAAEEVYEAVQRTFFGQVRVSVMLDANGCNTTAAAAVVTAGKHLDLLATTAAVLGGTGPVGVRVAQMLAASGSRVIVLSRRLEKAEAVCDRLKKKVPGADLHAASMDDAIGGEPFASAELIIGCGAAGVELIDGSTLASLSSLRVAIDLNAVPPAGIAGVDVRDKANPLRPELLTYGALGVGGLKMKTHKASIERLFQSNDASLDAAEIYDIAKSLA